MSVAVLALGSNLGDREGYLAMVVDELAARVVAASSVCETEPLATEVPQSQGRYLNAVVIAEDAAWGARQWLSFAREMEQRAGRVRGEKWGPRTLDVDVITVTVEGEPVLSDDPELLLPHPRAHERAFVLEPWLEADPDAILPGHGPLSLLLGTTGRSPAKPQWGLANDLHCSDTPDLPN